MNRRLFLALFLLVILGLSTSATAAQNSYSLWFANFWDNTNLEGNPIASSSSGVIDFDWGSGSPGGVPNNDWSGQWTTSVEFSPGTYRFTTQNDDGVRVYLGDKHIIVDWTTHTVVTNQATVSLLGGTYWMAVDFFDETGRALLKLGWERIGPPRAGAADVTVISSGQVGPPPAPPPSASAWQAQYWNNTSLAGNPALTRNEAAINYDWGTGSPAPGIVGADNFSARWSRSLYFETGRYRFTTQSDDGIRVSIGGNRIIDNWTAHAVQTNTAEVDLAAGTYAVVVEYFEQTGLAVAKFWWEKIGGGGSGPTGASATTLAFWLNMRSGPGTNYTILTALPRGTTVPVVGRTSTSRWIQVVYRGTTGWLSTPYTTVHGDLNSVPITWP